MYCRFVSPAWLGRRLQDSASPAAFRGNTSLNVSVANVRVDHQVKMADFERWLEKPGGSPREVAERQRIQAILGMEVSR